MEKLRQGDALAFASERADLSLRLWGPFLDRLKARKLLTLFDDLELPLIPILAEMEMNGVGIDARFFADMSRRLGKGSHAAAGEIFTAVAGAEFNINSTPQLREVLFDVLGLPVLKRTKTGPSTDSSVLERLAVDGHELPKLLLEYRQLEKLRSTYVDALPSLVNPETRRIHTTFNQTVAATGRLSSSDPNLQNIPVRTDMGREIRRGFTAPPGFLLLAADYSQIELRILAHFSGDDVFTRAFRENKDVHRETAAVIFDVPVSEVTGHMRDQAENRQLRDAVRPRAVWPCEAAGHLMNEAKAFIAQYFERFAGVRQFLDEQVAQARSQGT